MVDIIRIPASCDELRVLLFSDGHGGHKCHDEQLCDDYLHRAKEDEMPIIVLGDLFENATKTSPGKGQEEEVMNKKEQLKYWRSKLRPYKHLIKGVVKGNHDDRSDFDPLDSLCSELEIPYNGYSGVVAFVSDKAHPCAYTFAFRHGSTGGATPAGAINAVHKDVWNYVADVYCEGHCHKVTQSYGCIKEVDFQNKKLKKRTQLFVTSGSLLNWKDSYAELKGYPEVPPMQAIVRLSMLQRNRGMWVET